MRRILWWHGEMTHDAYPTIARCNAQFEISERTARRDLDFLRDQVGAPIAYHHRRRGYYYTEPFNLPMLTLSEGELVAVLLAEKVLKQYEGTPYARQLRAAFEKICGALVDEVTLDPAGLDKVLSFDLGPPRPMDVETFRTLVLCIRIRESVEMTYYVAGRGELTERCVDPLHLHATGSDWFLVAFCHLRGEVRDFALSRIRHLQRTRRRFTPPRDFDCDAYLRQAFRKIRGGTPTEVALHFDPVAARWVRERQWHHTQRLEEQPDESVILRMTIPVSVELVGWVLHYGGHCRILEPEDLRRAVVEEAHKLVAMNAP